MFSVHFDTKNHKGMACISYEDTPLKAAMAVKKETGQNVEDNTIYTVVSHFDKSVYTYTL